MKICDYLNPDKIIPELKGNKKEEIIDELIDLFKDDKRIFDLETVREAVKEREKIMSTGVGKGVAIPHAKTTGTNEILVAFGKKMNPIDFEALDNQPVKLFFLLIGQENLVGPHIKLLSRISRLMNKDEFRETLAMTDDPAEIYRLFEEQEKKYLDIN